jgi:predicted HicB family RNase H-like nuclease
MTMPTTKDLGTSKDGTPITDELVEDLAREAEAGYDLSRARRVGRRSLAGGDGKSPRLNIRLTAELYERAAKRAQNDGLSLSELAREALAEYVR